MNYSNYTVRTQNGTTIRFYGTGSSGTAYRFNVSHGSLSTVGDPKAYGWARHDLFQNNEEAARHVLNEGEV